MIRIWNHLLNFVDLVSKAKGGRDNHHKLFWEIKALINFYPNIQIIHIYRSLNKAADEPGKEGLRRKKSIMLMVLSLSCNNRKRFQFIDFLAVFIDGWSKQLVKGNHFFFLISFYGYFISWVDVASIALLSGCICSFFRLYFLWI